MFTITLHEPIDRPVEVVSAFAGDYANDPKWREGITEMRRITEGPLGVGTQTREVLKSMGRDNVTVGEVVEYVPNQRIAFRSLKGPIPVEGFREFAASTNGTDFTYSLTLKPSGFWWVLQPVLKSMLRKSLAADMKRLKAAIEAE